MKIERNCSKLQSFWFMLYFMSKSNDHDKLIIGVFKCVIFQLIEGYPPFYTKQENEVPKVYAARQRPPFKAPTKHYAHGLKEYVRHFYIRKSLIELLVSSTLVV